MTTKPDNFRGLRLFGLARLPLLAWLTVLTLTLGGCLVAIRDTSGPSAPTPDDESFAEFMDVPYPAVMALEKDDTYIYTRRDVRAGVVTLLGRMTVEELGAYYDAHLPSHGWTPVAEAQNIKLVSTWVKGGKILTIIATPVIMAIGGNLRVELWVGAPRSQADLGHRPIYRSTEGGEPIIRTTPVRGSGSRSGGIDEENI
jgi:hypothetical protein